MQVTDFEETIEKIVAADGRFERNAYRFMRDAVDHAQKLFCKNKKRHVSGQELLEAVREYALSQYGPMTFMVLDEWGVRRCEDFGDIVFNMIEHKLLSKSESDQREHFRGGYDFHKAFVEPFLPASKRSTSSSQPSPETTTP